MEIDEQVKLSHLLFSERRCRVCGEVKDLISEFYMTRKNRKDLLSSYSYECKTVSYTHLTLPTNREV